MPALVCQQSVSAAPEPTPFSCDAPWSASWPLHPWRPVSPSHSARPQARRATPRWERQPAASAQTGSVRHRPLQKKPTSKGSEQTGFFSSRKGIGMSNRPDGQANLFCSPLPSAVSARPARTPSGVLSTFSRKGYPVRAGLDNAGSTNACASTLLPASSPAQRPSV